MVRLAITERRELLIAAAWRVMVNHGVAAATTRAICAEAGMPQSSFHYCFDSRTDLLKIVVTSRIPGYVERSVEQLETTGTVLERAHRTLGAYWKDVVENPAMHAVFFDIAMTSYYDPELRELGAFQYQQFHQAAVSILSHVVADGQYVWLDDIDTLAVNLVAFLDGTTLRYIIDPSTPGLDDALRGYGEYLATRLRAVQD
ncbi:TetR/AcrR family transcriptional regulator [Blastococcus sp. Marseille-P5729]|uniref:TetR/AcrR family transcriptional regulator n=1 Tax=Blastococcus sp. Marseille-P5729 TaxID=2086582 RepID=UPI000D10D8C9|nr:TetR/AcrR family transcriptional regulator [Blastococcus sp. Marseille-P5729]